MRMIALTLAAAGAAVAMPAAAQVAGARVGVDTGAVADTVQDTTQNTLEGTQEALDQTEERARMMAATTAQLRAGVEVRDSTGAPVGTITQVDGDIAMVSDGSATYAVPASALFAPAEGAVPQLFTNVPRAQLEATGEADADAAAGVETDDGM